MQLKSVASKVDLGFRTCDRTCYRQVSLDKSSLWKLGDSLHLSEDVSAWTESLAVAKTFKAGVPPAGWQRVIFAIKPPKEAVVINLAKLFRDGAFRRCYRLHSHEIKGFSAGIGRYEDGQSEVVLQIKELRISDVYSLGGYSSDRIELAREYFGREPTQADLAKFDVWLKTLESRGERLGPAWIEGKPRTASSLRF